MIPTKIKPKKWVSAISVIFSAIFIAIGVTLLREIFRDPRAPFMGKAFVIVWIAVVTAMGLYHLLNLILPRGMSLTLTSWSRSDLPSGDAHDQVKDGPSFRPENVVGEGKPSKGQ